MVEKGCCKKKKKEETILYEYFSLKINPYSNVPLFLKAQHMENHGIKINVVIFIFMFFFAGEIRKFYTNSKKRLLSVALNHLRMKCSIHMTHNEKLEHSKIQRAFGC